MKPNIIHSIAVCLAAFALPFMVACSSQEESLPEVGSGIQAVFSLDLGDKVYGTSRATPTDGEYNPGSGLENYIDLTQRNFRCYLFGTDNRLVSALAVAAVYDFGDGKYSVRLRLDDTDEVKQALTAGCRFVLLANWGSYGEPTPGMTIEEICTGAAAKFDFSQEMTQLSENNLIPMYGVKEFESGVQDFIEGKDVSDIGTLHLLRAYAKIDVNVIFKDFEDVPVVTSVSLTHSSDKGYKAPANVTKQEQYVTGSWFTDYTPVNIPTDAADIQLSLIKETGTGHYVAYVPEYQNVNDQKNPVDNPSRIKICFTIGDLEAGGREVEGYVDFRYSDAPSTTGVVAGQHFDIARNNWYKFDVTVNGKDIDWTVDVIPFTSVELAPDMGLKREEFTGYVIGKDLAGRDCWYDGNYYDPATAIPLYLGPKDNHGNFVTINGKEYLLVYADYERTAAKLDHIFEKETRKKYLLYPAGRTGYKNVSWEYYLNDLKQRVWLDEDKNEWEVKWNPDYVDPNSGIKGRNEWVYTEGKWYRTLNEWDRLDWNRAVYDKKVQDPRIYPKFWFDVLGNRYPWSLGDTKEKRAAILKEWVNYLE